MIESPSNSGSLWHGSLMAKFVLGMYALEGAMIEEVDWGVYDVLDARGELRRITFDVEVAQDRNDCDLVAVGTPLFEEVQQSSETQGTGVVRRLPLGEIIHPKQWEDKVGTLVHFEKCRPPRAIASWANLEGSAVLFRFRVVYQMAEVVEEIITVVIDGGTLADITFLLPQLELRWIESTTGGENVSQSAIRQIQPPHSMLDIYRVAVRRTTRQVSHRMRQLEQEHQGQRQEEFDQSDRYYQTTLTTLRSQLKNTGDVTRAGHLEAQIVATQADWDRRHEDIARAYQINAEIALDQTIVYLVPILSMEVAVQQRTNQWPFWMYYYPWAKAWSPVVCPTCYEVTPRLWHDPQGWHCGCRTNERDLSSD